MRCGRRGRLSGAQEGGVEGVARGCEESGACLLRLWHGQSEAGFGHWAVGNTVSPDEGYESFVVFGVAAVGIAGGA
jgi:hypothetical protein